MIGLGSDKNLDQTLCSSLDKSLPSWPDLSFQICNKLLPARSSSATVTMSTSFELVSSHARVTSIKFTKQWVSQWVTDKHCQWSDSGLIKTRRQKDNKTKDDNYTTRRPQWPCLKKVGGAVPRFFELWNSMMWVVYVFINLLIKVWSRISDPLQNPLSFSSSRIQRTMHSSW